MHRDIQEDFIMSHEKICIIIENNLITYQELFSNI